MIKKKAFFTPNEKISIHDKIIRFAFGTIIFSLLVIFGTYYLQITAFYKVAGNYIHWLVILFLLPSISGLLQHLIDPPAKLFVSIAGAIISSCILYYFYSNNFWATPPSYMVSFFFAFIIAGVGFTCSINPLDRHFHQRRTRKKPRKITKIKNVAHSKRKTKAKKFSAEGLLNSSMIRTFELMLTILGFILGIWGTVSMGIQQ